MTFEQWFYDRNSLDSFTLRAEYFYDDLEADIPKDRKAMRMLSWIEAAFEAGKEAARQELKNG